LVAEVHKTSGGLKLERLTYVIDPGIAVHPGQVIAQIQSGAVSGLINTFRSKITLRVRSLPLSDSEIEFV
jgi:isoquinoline 1-oxidoreductase beta subunit